MFSKLVIAFVAAACAAVQASAESHTVTFTNKYVFMSAIDVSFDIHAKL